MKIPKIILIFFILISIPNISFAIDTQIIETQIDELNIEAFTNEASKYTNEIFEGMNANELLSLAISGDIDNKNIFKNIINTFMNELYIYIKSIRNYTCNNSNT